MQMNHDEYLEVQNQLQDHFDVRYRKIDDCDEISKSAEYKIGDLNEEFAKLREEVRVNRAKTNTRLNILIAILSAIAVPILGVCVKLLFG